MDQNRRRSVQPREHRRLWDPLYAEPTIEPLDPIWDACGPCGEYGSRNVELGDSGLISLRNVNPGTLLHEQYHAWIDATMDADEREEYFDCRKDAMAAWLHHCRNIADSLPTVIPGVPTRTPGPSAPTPTPFDEPTLATGQQDTYKFCAVIVAADQKYKGKYNYIEEMYGSILNLVASCDMLDCGSWMPPEFLSAFKGFLDCASSASDLSCP